MAFHVSPWFGLPFARADLDDAQRYCVVCPVCDERCYPDPAADTDDVSGWAADHTPDATQHDTEDGPAVCILADGTVHLFGAVTFLAGQAAQDYLDEHLAGDDSVCPHVSHCPHCYATDAVPLSAGLSCTNAWHHGR